MDMCDCFSHGEALCRLAGHDIKIVDKQVENQQKRVDVAKAELCAQKQQAADAAETEEVLRTKYSSNKLYSWLEAETRMLVYQFDLAALDLARTAERALQWEYGRLGWRRRGLI